MKKNVYFLINYRLNILHCGAIGKIITQLETPEKEGLAPGRCLYCAVLRVFALL
ncbi:hypothetical protein [Roseibium aggregatum]|uniref:Uncharacterized protein n=1 Tax=Roseibium aggregatum TaxID=187304 RepID=A0A939EFX9_9HYPH|nr:hypothetical protein [Roseibium aggregatum]MBN9671991.1 hypothetical protein [Roseibium aggregatum]